MYNTASNHDGAVDWLDDKLVKSKFALPGVYWAASKIPLEIWKAAPSTTNGNEQAHRNINRDGINLTLLAGVMRGLQYDVRALKSIESVEDTGVNVRDAIATHHHRSQRAITRKGTSEHLYKQCNTHFFTKHCYRSESITVLKTQRSSLK